MLVIAGTADIIDSDSNNFTESMIKPSKKSLVLKGVNYVINRISAYNLRNN